MSEGNHPDTFGPQPEPAEDQARGHDSERQAQRETHRRNAVDVLNSRKLKRHVRQRPDDGRGHDGATRTDLIRQ